MEDHITHGSKTIFEEKNIKCPQDSRSRNIKAGTSDYGNPLSCRQNRWMWY